MVDDIKAVRLMQGRGKFGQKRLSRHLCCSSSILRFPSRSVFNLPAKVEN